MKDFYVYAYLRTSGTPYYIGKGSGRRAYSKHGKWHPPKDRSRIVFLETKLTEIGALALERRYIKWYGREINNGILKNKTEGGDGCDSMRHSVETRAVIGFKSSQKVYSDEYRAKLSNAQINRIRTPDHNQRISEALTGKTKSDEHKAKLSHSRQQTPTIICPHCNKTIDPGNYQRWHGDNCKTLRN